MPLTTPAVPRGGNVSKPACRARSSSLGKPRTSPACRLPGITPSLAWPLAPSPSRTWTAGAKWNWPSPREWRRTTGMAGACRGGRAAGGRPIHESPHPPEPTCACTTSTAPSQLPLEHHPPTPTRTAWLPLAFERKADTRVEVLPATSMAPRIATSSAQQAQQGGGSGAVGGIVWSLSSRQGQSTTTRGIALLASAHSAVPAQLKPSTHNAAPVTRYAPTICASRPRSRR